ncbi:hypothetical protein CD30_19385 [Ureibacillus massiliensis 4400831 = CIP 108448 = CCUG 49529]|uniref:Uncharacterized protein n=1 Tax=Ureibacillus massiliensis 4400831 = CIP 108448 = CCUG 49529 TaxID=1211035 RepID=A0A0A3IG64_9BACL|nr:hypothetical protein [Ureibacillus massiliensis]KGR83734.1 hypothetical protein CD30_19385 [Ureibacillus massiliensis 4400831 = CIP 108448 = CCUG 49529]
MGSVGNGEFGRINDAKNYNEERCLRELLEVDLQDVANSEYFNSEGEVPEIFSIIHLGKKLKNGRVQVILTDDESEIGLLPTQYNYLHTCIARGHKYSGTIVYSENAIFPKIVVNLYAK